jgi:hypothetical protein
MAFRHLSGLASLPHHDKVRREYRYISEYIRLAYQNGEKYIMISSKTSGIIVKELHESGFKIISNYNEDEELSSLTILFP